MISILLAFLVAAGPQDFPETDDAVVDDVVEPAAPAPARARPPVSDLPVAEPEDAGPESDAQWRTKSVRPRDISPAAANPAAPAPPPPVQSNTVRSAPGAAPAAPAARSAPAANQPFIAGYHDSLWGDTKETVQRAYTSERPLVERGENKWMLQDKCEGEDAVVVYAFPGGSLASITCQYKRGLEASTPDYPLYKKVRNSLVKLLGEPTSTNESPAPDSPSQAAQWDGKSGKATLVFDAEGAYVQLKVEKRP
jgi:hypothetical protein